jgi:rhamnosyltransferase
MDLRGLIMSKQRVSIIMRSKNSDWVIGEALAALFSQTFQDFELIVVDSGSTDNTLDIVSHYPCRLIQIEPGDYYPGKVLNDAIHECSSELIVFLNSDSVMLSPHSLDKLLSKLSDKDMVAVFGRQLPRPEAHTWVLRDYALSFPASGAAPDWITLSLPLAAFRRNIWEKHPFYTDAWASEDTEWGNWARQKGLKVGYAPDAITMHSHNYTLKEIYGRRFVEGEADTFIYAKSVSLFSIGTDLVKSFLRDIPLHLKKGDLLGFFAIIPRRFFYHWAYFKGRQIGLKRQASNNNDCSEGQSVVLNSLVK